jgi:L-2,4-diaminobutyrate decarboxylase
VRVIVIEKSLSRKPLFILPDGSNREAVRQLGQQFLDLTIDALTGAAEQLPLPPITDPSQQVSPVGEPYQPPATGRDADDLIAQIRKEIVGRVMNVSNPSYIGHMDTLSGAIGAFSDILISALNNNMLCWEMSPVFTEMEANLLRWFTRAIGWTDEKYSATGFLVSGGSLANLSAILAGRNVMCGTDFREKGLASAPGAPVIFASEEVHYSLDKIANILGLGSQGLVKLPTDENLALKPEALEAAIADVKRQGRWPFCVVGIAGTTISGSVDPLEEIGDIAARHNLWFHVDAAYGGSLLVSHPDRCQPARSRLQGIERADSVTFNPQKWLFVPKVCAGVFFKDSPRVADAVRQTFPYSGPGTGGEIDQVRRNVGEYTIQGTRRVDILKLWLTLEYFGIDCLSDLMEDCLHRARHFTRRIKESGCCRLLCQPQMNIVCFRYEPPGWDIVAREDEITEINRRIHETLAADGPGWLSFPKHIKRRWLRTVILHPLAREELLDQVIDQVIVLGRSYTPE